MPLTIVRRRSAHFVDERSVSATSKTMKEFDYQAIGQHCGLLRRLLFPGIKSTVVETQRADHAKEIVTGLSLSELQSFDGFIAVRPSPCIMLLCLGCQLSVMWHDTAH